MSVGYNIDILNEVITDICECGGITATKSHKVRNTCNQNIRQVAEVLNKPTAGQLYMEVKPRVSEIKDVLEEKIIAPTLSQS